MGSPDGVGLSDGRLRRPRVLRPDSNLYDCGYLVTPDRQLALIDANHGSLEGMTLHAQLRDLLAELAQLGSLVARKPFALTPLDAVLVHQFPSVPSWIPRSRAICAIGLPVSRTIRTAPSRNSGSYFRRVSGITTPHKGCLHTSGGFAT
jgi:hypothetical protein